jgi:hypothetical protein
MKKRLLFSCVTLAALGGVWLAGFKTRPALAQQASPPEVTIPRAFGTLKASDGKDYWFEAPDGTIRWIHLTFESGTFGHPTPPTGTLTYAVWLVLHRT